MKRRKNPNAIRRTRSDLIYDLSLIHICYGDRGREALDQVYAFALGAEDALVRHNFVCGTHALTVALFGVLRPGDVYKRQVCA